MKKNSVAQLKQLKSKTMFKEGRNIKRKGGKKAIQCKKTVENRINIIKRGTFSIFSENFHPKI